MRACEIVSVRILHALISMHYAQMHCTRRKKPVSKGYLLYNSIYMTFQKGQDYKDRKQISGSRELVVGMTTKGLKEFSR